MSRGCDLKHHEKLGHKPGPSGMPGLDKIPRQAKAAVPQPQFFRVCLGGLIVAFPGRMRSVAVAGSITAS